MAFIDQGIRYGLGLDDVVEYDDTLGEYFYYFKNALGSIEAITDRTNQQQVEQARYNEFGETNFVTISGGGASSSGSSGIGSDFLFTGRQWDPETGSGARYHFRARDYDPKWGRFRQRDPMGYHDGPGLYSYAGQDPINFRDPFGTSRDGGATCSLMDPNDIQAPFILAYSGTDMWASQLEMTASWIGGPAGNPYLMGRRYGIIAIGVEPGALIPQPTAPIAPTPDETGPPIVGPITESAAPGPSSAEQIYGGMSKGLYGFSATMQSVTIICVAAPEPVLTKAAALGLEGLALAAGAAGFICGEIAYAMASDRAKKN